MSVKQALSEALGNVTQAGGNQPRGLNNFIQEIRQCTNAAEEQQRVDKELANIRNKFSSSSGLSSYNRKKYVWKLVYMFMLGYEIDFGHMEMISLISSTRYSEKNVGYIAVSLLLRSGDTMMTLVINSIRNDLTSHSSPAQTLALATVANLGGSDLCEALLPDVERLLVTKGTDPAVRKKAALCYLRFFREDPGNLVHAEWSDKMARLLENKNLGVVTSVMSLLMGLAVKSPQDYEGLVPLVIHLLTRLVIHKACASEYLYYGTPTPWLHVKLLKFLQLFPPPADGSQREKLDEALERIMTKTEVSTSVNKSNADHCILFEAVNVIIHHGQDSNEDLRAKAMTLLGRFIAVKEPNIRYLGLEVMSRLARLEGNESTKKHQATVLMSLKDADISIRRRALDVLFVMADEDNAADIVQELVTYLAASDAAIREEMVLKIAILAEKFTDDLNWYVDKMLEMIAVAGDFVAGAVWHRIIQIVTNHKELQAYAADRLFVTLRSKRAHETAVSVGGYILGEFGYFIAEQENKSGEDQFHVLHQHFADAGPAAKALLLSTYAKLANLYPECRDLVTPVFERMSYSQNLELQQRACEYLGLPQMGIDVMEEVLKEMPAFPDDRESGPEARLRRRLEEQELGAEEGLRKNAPGGGGGAAGGEEFAESEERSIVERIPRGRRDRSPLGRGVEGRGAEELGSDRDGGAAVAGEEGGGGKELAIHESSRAVVEVDDLLGIGDDDNTPAGPLGHHPTHGGVAPPNGVNGNYYNNQQQQQIVPVDGGMTPVGYGQAQQSSMIEGAVVPYGQSQPAQQPGNDESLIPIDGATWDGGVATGSTGVIIDDGGYPNEGGVAGVVNNLVPYGDPGVGVGVGGGANGGGGYDGGVPGGFGHGSNSAGIYGGGGGGDGGDALVAVGGGIGVGVGVVYGPGGEGSSPAAAGAIGVPASMEGQVQSWFNALTVAGRGILFEGGPIKVGIIHEYRMSQGRVTMYYYNLSGGPIMDLKTDIPSVPFLRAQVGEAPTALDAGGRAQQVLMCECMQPFAEFPVLNLSFEAQGKRYALSFNLPVAACCFMDPLQLEAMDFLRRWDMLTGAPREQMCQVTARSAVTAERWAEIRSMITSGMKMGVTDGVASAAGGDNASPTLYAAGTFRTGSVSPESGAKISLGAMLRLEAEPAFGTFRMTVRAVHGTVAAALRDVLVAQLGTLDGV